MQGIHKFTFNSIQKLQESQYHVNTAVLDMPSIHIIIDFINFLKLFFIFWILTIYISNLFKSILVIIIVLSFPSSSIYKRFYEFTFSYFVNVFLSKLIKYKTIGIDIYNICEFINKHNLCSHS